MVPWQADLVSRHTMLSPPIPEVLPLALTEFTKCIEDLIRIKKCSLSLLGRAILAIFKQLNYRTPQNPTFDGLQLAFIEFMMSKQDEALVGGASFFQYAENYCDALWLYHVLMDPDIMWNARAAETLWGKMEIQYPITPQTLGTDFRE